jgi:hypothetical protein
MTSQAKIEANRRNSLKSTGPRTERGKERAKLNALRHGMRAKQLVARGEDFGDFGRFSGELRAALAPGDALEEQLVESIVAATWRLRRVWRTEAALIQGAARRSDTWENAELAPVPFTLAGHDLERISRYEATLHRSLQRAYAMLELRQRHRAAEAARTSAPLQTTEAKTD